MSRELSSRHGAFSWVGLLAGDVERATWFYGELFGWAADAGSTADASGYCLMRLHGEAVALIYEIADWQRDRGAPANWATFVTVDDVDASVRKAVELGGAVAIAPYRLREAARIAVVIDPGGARLSLWQPLADLAPSRGGRVGTCCWNELATEDPDIAGAFYTGLFGWELDREPDGCRIVSDCGVVQGSIRARGAREPARARWLPYFRVASVHDAVERCAHSDGQIAEPPGERLVAVLQDRDGASFGVCARLPSASPAASVSGGAPAAPAA